MRWVPFSSILISRIILAANLILDSKTKGAEWLSKYSGDKLHFSNSLSSGVYLALVWWEFLIISVLTWLTVRNGFDLKLFKVSLVAISGRITKPNKAGFAPKWNNELDILRFWSWSKFWVPIKLADFTPVKELISLTFWRSSKSLNFFLSIFIIMII